MNLVEKNKTNDEISPDYIRVVNEYADAKDPIIFNNQGPEHAAVVLSAIFKHSKDWVYIYANNMDGEIGSLPKYMVALEELLGKKKTLKIILDDDSVVASENLTSALSLIKRYNENNSDNKVRFVKANEKFKKEVEKVVSVDMEFTDIHFTLADKQIWRIETDNKSHQAYVSFNNPKYYSDLLGIYNKYFDELDPVVFS